MILIIEWIGTVFVLVGGLLITRKRASNPKKRKVALYFYIVGTLAFGWFAWLIQAYGLLVTQTVFFFINLRGVVRCIKEIKHFTDGMFEDMAGLE